MPATSTDALITRVGELILSGSGTDPYTIPTGTFSMDFWYPGREIETLPIHALTKPQVKIEMERMVDRKAWPRPSTSTMYDIELHLGFAYYTGEKILRNVNDNLAKRIGNDIHLISKCLQHPQNLKQTDAGDLTGLAGGLLEMQDESVAFEWERENSIVAGELVFRGFLVLSSST